MNKAVVGRKEYFCLKDINCAIVLASSMRMESFTLRIVNPLITHDHAILMCISNPDLVFSTIVALVVITGV